MNDSPSQDYINDTSLPSWFGALALRQADNNEVVLHRCNMTRDCCWFIQSVFALSSCKTVLRCDRCRGGFCQSGKKRRLLKSSGIMLVTTDTRISISMDEIMSPTLASGIFTALATGLLVLVGFAQVVVLRGQRRQQRLDQAETYRKRWADCRDDWAKVVFLGHDKGAYYQVADSKTVEMLEADVASGLDDRLAWAYDSVRSISALFSDVSLRILQGQLQVSDVYPVFGSELLRQSRQLRNILEQGYSRYPYGRSGPSPAKQEHDNLRGYLNSWLVYHDGIRRRCLILIDLLWAEAARLEDLPPDDLKGAADAKIVSGDICRKRLSSECKRLNGYWDGGLNKKLTNFLRHAEYRRKCSRVGIDPSRLALLDKEWVNRLLHNPPDQD